MNGGSTADSSPSAATSCWVPQWSPPVTGGNTLNFLDSHGYFFDPQWSPSTTGGSTPVLGNV